MFLALALLAACSVADDESALPADSPVVEVPPCTDSVPVLTAAGAPTGYVRCADGGVDRIEALPLVPEDYTAAITACDPREDGSCDSDADCTAHPGGHCYHSGGTYGFPPYCGCTYPCASDADCAAGSACVAPETFDLPLAWPVCVEVACRVDADCGSGRCGVFALYNCGYGEVTLRCRQPGDACAGPDDCPDSNSDRNCWAYQGVTACVKDACD